MIEVLVSVVLMGTAGLAVLTAMATATRGATEHNDVAESQAWLATAADLITDPEAYHRGCVSDSDRYAIANDYEAMILGPVVAESPSAPTIDVAPVEFWNSDSGTYGVQCRRTSDGDRLQRVTIRTSIDGDERTAVVVKRPPPSVAPSVGVGPLPPSGVGSITPDPNPTLKP